MKKIIAIIGFALLMTAGPAFAASWSLNPTGPVDVSSNSVGDIVQVELWLNVDSGISSYVTGIDLDFAIDLAEVTPDLTKLGAPIITWNVGAGFATIASQLVGSTVSYAGGNLSGANQLAAGMNLIATMDLELVSVAGLADGGDFDLLAQAGFKGIADYYGVVANLNAAAGPDYSGGVPPIPIPGAVYLLLSGFIGLIGLRRKMK